jgi:integrase
MLVRSSKGGRPAKGSTEWRRNPKTGRSQWFARVSLLDGTRPFVELDPAIPREDEQRARDCASAISGMARHAASVPVTTKETVSEWVERWIADRETRGILSHKHDHGRLRRHVLSTIGHLDVTKVSTEDIERVVEDLDRKVRLPEGHEDRLAWKTASNVWVLVTKMFDDAVKSKRRDLRVRKERPTLEVRGPDRGVTRAKQYLYPSELLRLVSCDGIDVAYRRLYVAAIYIFARAGELEALTWDDVDMEHRVIHINKAVDRATNRVKSTKSGDTRRLPIEPNLLPLLRVLKEQTKGPRCFWMPDDEDRAIRLRQHIFAARIGRAELLTSDAHRKHIVFHDLRATGITWMAVRGDDPLRIKQRAGHKSFSTTEGYIREAENLREGFGVPFPQLPLEVLGGFATVLGSATAELNKPAQNDTLKWSKGGSNP